MKKILAIGKQNKILVADNDRVIELTKLDNSYKLVVGTYTTYVSSLEQVERDWLRKRD